MASKKKFTLKEFMEDDSLGGGSWADEEFDLSSISVPLMNQQKVPLHHSYVPPRHHEPSYGGPPPQHMGYHNGGGSLPSGPPFIVKLTNIPSYFGDEHINDLFQSRFLSVVKFKLFWEIDHGAVGLSQKPSDMLNKRRKASFVELHSSSDMQKVLKWHDVYIENGLGKLHIEPANFDDFRMYNETHQNLSPEDDPSLSLAKKRALQMKTSPLPPAANLHRQPHAAVRDGSKYHPHQPKLNHMNPHPHDLPPLHPPSPAPAPKKANPFGNAKPVDTLSKELELEKKLQALKINNSTFRTLGSIEKDESKTPKEGKVSPKADEAPAKPEQTAAAKTSSPKPNSPPSHTKSNKAEKNDPELKPAPQPAVTAWGQQQKPTYSEVASPPKGHTELYRDSASPGPVSSFGSKKSKSHQDDHSKKVLVLKRKHQEPKKKDKSPTPPKEKSTPDPISETTTVPPEKKTDNKNDKRAIVMGTKKDKSPKSITGSPKLPSTTDESKKSDSSTPVDSPQQSSQSPEAPDSKTAADLAKKEKKKLAKKERLQKKKKQAESTSFAAAVASETATGGTEGAYSPGTEETPRTDVTKSIDGQISTKPKRKPNGGKPMKENEKAVKENGESSGDRPESLKTDETGPVSSRTRGGRARRGGRGGRAPRGRGRLFTNLSRTYNHSDSKPETKPAE